MRALLDRVTPGADPGPYLIQACIAALHAQAADTASTGWEEIHALYTVLEHLTGGRNPTIALNRIVAQAMSEGIAPALAALADLESQHPRLPRLASVRAHLLERSGRIGDAIEAYRKAIAATINVAEQRYLRYRLQRLVAAGNGDGSRRP